MTEFIRRLCIVIPGGVLIWLVFHLGLAGAPTLERAATDLRAQIAPPPPSAEVVVIALDARWDTRLLADVVTHADRAGATAIGVAIPLGERTAGGGGDNLLSALAQTRAPLVIGRADEQDAATARLDDPIAQATDGAGHLHLADPWSSPHIRAFPGVRTTDRASAPSFAMALAEAAGARRSEPTAIDFAASAEGMGAAFAAFPAGAVFAAPAAAFRNRVVVIGEAQGERAFLAPDGAALPPLAIHAHAVAQLLDGRDRPAGAAFAGAAAAVLTALLGALAIRRGGWGSTAMLAGVAAVILLAGWFAYQTQLWAAPVAAPLLALGWGALAMGLRNDGGRRRRRRARLGHRCAPALARRLARMMDRPGWFGAPAACVVLHVDAPGLGAALARARARVASETAEAHDAAIADAAARFGGYLAETGADRWTLVFGWSDDAEYAGAAARCAAALPLIFADLAQSAAEGGIDATPPRIGVAAGRAAPRRGRDSEDPPLIFGPAVELARRLAQAADRLGVATLICAATVRAAQASEEEPPHFRPLGDAEMAGGEVRIFTVAAGSADRDYAEGFARLEAGAADAAPAFQRALQRNPDDDASAMQLRRLWRGECSARLDVAA